MSTYVYEGQVSEPTTDIEDAVETLLNSASWTETDPARTDITWGNDSQNDYGDYHIHVVRVLDDPTDDTIGGKTQEWDTEIAIHVWVRTATENTKPAQIGKIQRQIRKIIMFNRTALASGIRDISPPRWNNPFTEDPQRTQWHVVGRCTVNYRMTVVSS